MKMNDGFPFDDVVDRPVDTQVLKELDRYDRAIRDAHLRWKRLSRLQRRVQRNQSILDTRSEYAERGLLLWGPVVISTAVAGTLSLIAMHAVGFRGATLAVVPSFVSLAALLMAGNRYLWSPDTEDIKAEIQRDNVELSKLGVVKDEYKKLKVEYARLKNSEAVRKARMRLAENEERKRIAEATSSLTKQNWRAMRGVPLEKFLAKVFAVHDWRVEETATSGDQGADLIIEKGLQRI